VPALLLQFQAQLLEISTRLVEFSYILILSVNKLENMADRVTILFTFDIAVFASLCCAKITKQMTFG